MRYLIVLLIIALPVYMFATDSGKKQLEKLRVMYYGDPVKNPRYAESRFKISAGSREIESVMYARMTEWDKCEEWLTHYQDDIVKSCPKCEVTRTSCDADPKPLYLRMFDNQKSHTTYLSMEREGEAFRKAVLVFWGLNADEAKIVCQNVKHDLEKQKGEVRITAQCI